MHGGVGDVVVVAAAAAAEPFLDNFVPALAHAIIAVRADAFAVAVVASLDVNFPK